MTLGTVNGVAAANRMATWRTYATGKCLQAVDQALQKPQSDRPGFYSYALRALETVPKKNRHKGRKPPKGAIVFFTAGGNGYGHICLSLGGGRVVSTDIPSSGRVGKTTIGDIEKRWGRKFICWTDWVMGYAVTTASTKKPKKEKDVPIPISKTFKLKKPQVVEAKAAMAPLWMNDRHDVSVVLKPHKHVTGNLQIRLRGGEPFVEPGQGEMPTAQCVQVRPVLRTWKNGKTTKVQSLGVREIHFSGGDTFGEVSVACRVKKGQRLSFEIGNSTQTITVTSATFRGAAFN